MPKKKKISRNTILVIVILFVAVSAVGVVAVHDGKLAPTPMESINDMTIASDTPVTVRGVITGIVATSVTVRDATGVVVFNWADAASLTPYTLVVVRGVVNSVHTLKDVTSVEQVWLFA
ncbi:MAG: hypothetical protein RTU63_13665 [Candidatus Thorarchaeota archaeon]